MGAPQPYGLRSSAYRWAGPGAGEKSACSPFSGFARDGAATGATGPSAPAAARDAAAGADSGRGDEGQQGMHCSSKQPGGGCSEPPFCWLSSGGGAVDGAPLSRIWSRNGRCGVGGQVRVKVQETGEGRCGAGDGEQASEAHFQELW